MSTLELAPGRVAHASGALWLPDLKTLLIADIHLGYGWALRRRGQLGPVQDPGTRQKLEAVFAELRPESVVFLGDVVHAPRPAAMERDLVEATLRFVAGEARTLIVRGNHDRGFAADYASIGIELQERWESVGIVAIHGDRPPGPVTDHLISGHLHPALEVFDDAGANQRIPVFLTSAQATVLPAFSPLAAGFNVRKRLPVEAQGLLGPGPIEVFAASGKRCLRLGPLDRIRRR